VAVEAFDGAPIVSAAVTANLTNLAFDALAGVGLRSIVERPDFTADAAADGVLLFNETCAVQEDGRTANGGNAQAENMSSETTDAQSET
jgi:hypothetical protein